MKLSFNASAVKLTPKEYALREGRAFLCSTANIDIQLPGVLDVILANPADSDVNMIVHTRRFSNHGELPLEYAAFDAAGAALDKPMRAVPLGNGASKAVASYGLRAFDEEIPGVAGSGEVIGPRSTAVRRLLAILKPGSAFAYRISGAGATRAFQQDARVACTLEWYEEPLT